MIPHARKLATPALAAIALALVAQSAAAQQRQAPRPVTRDRIDHRSVDIQPLISLEQTDTSRTRRTQSPVGGYVRFIIERSADDDNQEIIYPSRNWISRFFVGRNVSRALTARIAVTGSNPIASTVTLASTAQHSNRRDGEAFSSELTERRLLTPYFRVDPGAALSIEVRMLASQRADADITRNFLSLVERAARLANPASSLVTSLTSNRLNDTSNFVDSSISQLFSESVTEDARLDVPVAEWVSSSRGSGTGIATIGGIFPISRDVRNAANFRRVGNWTVSVSEPIVSIFSHEPVGSAYGIAAQRVSRSLTPEQVLAFPIDDSVSLGEVLRGDGGVSATLLRLDPDGSNASTIVRELCSRVSERARDLGLNQYDTAAALWAISWSGMLSDKIAGTLWAEPAAGAARSYVCETIRLAVQFGLTKPQAAANSVIVTQEDASRIRANDEAQSQAIADLTRRLDALRAAGDAGATSRDPDVPGIDTAPRPEAGSGADPEGGAVQPQT